MTLTLKTAKEIYKKHTESSGLDHNYDCGCFPYEPNKDCYEAKGFLEGHAVAEKKAERLVKALENFSNPGQPGWGIAKEALETYRREMEIKND